MNRENINSVLRALRNVNYQGSFFGQTVAIRFGLSESDVEALELLIDAGSATAGKLSDVMGLTTGAVTRVIDRLEQAGYVRRVPDPADRRRVIVEVVPEKVAGIEATIGLVDEKGASEISHYSDADLAVINDFLTRMAAITRDEATALRDAPGTASSGSEHAAPIGGLDRARLLFRSGANELLLRGSQDLGDDLYRARFEGAVPQVRLREGVVTVQYKGRFQWDWRDRRSDVSLNAGLPWDVEVIGGANKLQGKLGHVDLRSFSVTGGLHQARLTLGRPTGIVPINLTGGANDIRIERPTGSAVRLRLTGGAAGVTFDQQQLGSSGGHTVLESSGASQAKDAYAVEITGGMNKVTIVEID